jgi:carbamoyl-phosphate synthase large subunit
MDRRPECPVTVLVTSAGSAPAVAVMAALREQQEIPVRVVAADMDPLSVGFHLSDAGLLVPPAGDPTFVDFMLSVCHEQGVEVVFPIIDEELQVFADAAPRFAERGIAVITNAPEVVRVARDKWLTYGWCRQHEVLAPRTWLAAEPPAAPTLPLVVKPRSGRGSVGVQVMRTAEELRERLAREPELLVQEFIEGPEFTVDILADREGRVLSAVPRERLMVKAGMCVKGRTVNDPRLLELSVHVAEEFGLTPRGNVQFCRSVRDGEYYLIEVNAKFGAGLPLTTAAGVNMPLLLLKMLRGDTRAGAPPSVGAFRSNLVMLRHWAEVFVAEDSLGDKPPYRAEMSVMAPVPELSGARE